MSAGAGCSQVLVTGTDGVCTCVRSLVKAAKDGKDVLLLKFVVRIDSLVRSDVGGFMGLEPECVLELLSSVV
jgi:hypothetical protein